MKSTKKLCAMALAIALPATLALTACGNDNEGTTGGPTGSNGDNTLTVWTWDPSFNIYAMQEAEKVYQKDHPDFKLNIVETPWDDLQTKLTTLAQSQAFDELPDIFLMQNNAFQKNVINYPDLFTDFSDSGIDFSEFPDGVLAYSVLDGVNYGVPFDAGTAIGAYRTDILEEAGLTISDFTDTTYERFIELGEQVKNETGKALLSGVAGEADTIMMMLQSAGASLFDAEGNPTITDNEALLAAIETYKELVDKGILTQVNSWDEYIATLVNGEVAGTINGVWIVGSIQTAEDQSGNWDITNLPKLGTAGATNYSANGGSSWAISSTANAELAQDFLKATFAGSTELYDTILPQAGAVANWTPAGDSSVYAEPQEFFSGEPIFQKVVEFGSSVPQNNTGAYYYEGRDAVSAAITQIIGGADPETALADAQKNVEFAMN
ncbi:ABC transporter substrate-binding protein [Populibacterium corticicola]|uniref:ABC transporter substrate-binding protein n=1 Tax=Populibacterium corticicola TaxID=1812826 RepID=A0ABW5XES8_9MICO